jgi:DNA-binding transcriptional MerR regulator
LARCTGTAAGVASSNRDALDLLDVVLRLRRTGMPVKEVRHFVDLVGSGDAELAGRLDLLRAHRRRVLAHSTSSTTIWQ